MNFPRVTRWYKCYERKGDYVTVNLTRLAWLIKKKEVMEKKTGIMHVVRESKGLIAIFVCQEEMNLPTTRS